MTGKEAFKMPEKYNKEIKTFQYQKYQEDGLHKNSSAPKYYGDLLFKKSWTAVNIVIAMFKQEVFIRDTSFRAFYSIFILKIFMLFYMSKLAKSKSKL